MAAVMQLQASPIISRKVAGLYCILPSLRGLGDATGSLLVAASRTGALSREPACRGLEKAFIRLDVNAFI
jgi:hypothetical protein